MINSYHTLRNTYHFHDAMISSYISLFPLYIRLALTKRQLHNIEPSQLSHISRSYQT